jgi:hypothetical protein
MPFYCEENVWRLVARPEVAEFKIWAVLASSRARRIVVLRQRLGRPLDGLIHWDYHVFALIEARAGELLALDPDTDLPFPCPAARYVEESFPVGVQSRLVPRFRILSGADYLRGLVSDRSHMRRPDGTWIAPPPPWPAPGAGKASNLMDWTDMERRQPGRLLDLKGLAAFIARGG